MADEVLRECEKIWHERLDETIKAIRNAVQDGVAKAFGG